MIEDVHLVFRGGWTRDTGKRRNESPGKSRCTLTINSLTLNQLVPVPLPYSLRHFCFHSLRWKKFLMETPKLQSRIIQGGGMFHQRRSFLDWPVRWSVLGYIKACRGGSKAPQLTKAPYANVVVVGWLVGWVKYQRIVEYWKAATQRSVSNPILGLSTFACHNHGLNSNSIGRFYYGH